MWVDWVKVGVGDVVRGARDGGAWSVEAKSDDGTTTIKNGDRQYTFVPHGSVERIYSADEARAAAEAAVKIVMPGSVEVAVLDEETNVWSAPNAYPDAGSLMSHAFVMHNRPMTEKPLPEMHAEHSLWHDNGHVETSHIHTSDWYRKRP